MKADPDVAPAENGKMRDDPDVGSLKRSDFDEFMMYSRPPDALLHVCVTALLALSMPTERGWKDVRIGMHRGNSGKFLEAVRAFDPVGIDPILFATLSERMEKYTIKQMYLHSKVGGALGVWLKTVVLSRSVE